MLFVSGIGFVMVSVRVLLMWYGVLSLSVLFCVLMVKVWLFVRVGVLLSILVGFRFSFGGSMLMVLKVYGLLLLLMGLWLLVNDWFWIVCGRVVFGSVNVGVVMSSV